jgi:hypothetical protein
MVLERLLDDPALNTFAASVNQPHFAKAGFMRGADVLDDDRRNVARRERVKIESRSSMGIFISIPNAQRPTSNHSQTPTSNDVQLKLIARLGIGKLGVVGVGSWKLGI